MILLNFLRPCFHFCTAFSLLFFIFVGTSFAHPVKVGVYENKPLVYRDAQGKYQGFSIDILRYVAAQEHLQLEFVSGSWPECLERLATGQIDLQVGIAVSPERQKLFAFSEQTLLTNWGRLYRNPQVEIDSLLDLSGKTVAVLDKDIHAKVFTELMGKFSQPVELKIFKSYDAVLEQVEAGSIDVGIVNRMYALQNARHFQVEATPMIFNPIEVRYASPRGESLSLLRSIDHHLGHLVADKGSMYYGSLEKWFGKDQPAETPAWIMPLLAVAGAVLVLGLIVLAWFRKQVSIKTLELKEINKTLAQQVDQLQRIDTDLHASEELHRNLLETTSEGFWLLDTEQKTTVINASLCRMLGYEQSEMIGKCPFDFADEDNRKIFLAELAKVPDSIHRSYEIQLQTKDGSNLPTLFNATTLFDKDDKIIGSFAFVTDLSDIKFSSAALQAEKELLSVTLRSIGDAVITTDINGRVTFLNRVAENLTGWSNEDAKGHGSQEIFNIINEKTGERCASPVQRVIDLGRIIGLANHTALIAKDGSIRSIADSGSPIRDAESKIIGVVIVFRDTTNEHRLEEELLKGRKLEAVGVLAGGIAHDFNNILTAILGNIELACHHIPEKEGKVAMRLREAQKATQRATKLTRQLLTFSKGGDPVKGVASLPELVKESADFVLPGSKVFCEYSFAKDLWQVEADSGQISQVIQNIIINADHAMPEGGKINIDCANVEDPVAESLLSVQEGSFVRISIHDSGVGIPREIIDKIFDPYFSTKQHGSGLGLAICHSIVNKHDGYLTVDSVPGKGTTFTLYLPALLSGVSKVEEKPKIFRAVKSARIMVMDDEEMLLDLAKSQLEALGHEALLVLDGDQAINRYQDLQDRGTPVDLVIMDLTIPGGMGGREAAEKLLKIDPNAKIIVASGYSNDPIMANYKEYGFLAAVAKPFDLKALNEAISTCIINEID